MRSIKMAEWSDWGVLPPGEWKACGRNWNCAFCAKQHGRPDRGDSMPEFFLCSDEVALPERLAAGFEFSRNRQKSYFYNAK